VTTSKRRAPKGIASAAVLFAALGDETRLGLLRRLAEGGPASITILSEPFEATRQGITKHLRVLAEAGMVKSHREGREHLWAFHPDKLTEAQRQLSLIAQAWDDALGRLKAHIERG
jgi:DNA-binding transcriptional ArsR family regulator